MADLQLAGSQLTALWLALILPGENYFTKFLFLFHYREHGGTPETLNSVTSEYWISKGRVVVRKIQTKCILCLKTEGYVIIIKLLVRCLEKVSR